MDELNNKFKKSAENFSLIPSTGIWQNVEADIRRRERKRRFIIFFFIGVAILTGGIFLFTDHSTTVNTQTELRNSPSAKEKATQQNISPGKNNSANENSSAPKTFSENKNQETSNEIAPQKNHSSNPVSLAQSTSGQSNLTTDSIKSDSSFANAKDTLQPETKKDSVVAIIADTTKKDTLIAAKDTSKISTHHSKWSFAISVAPTISYTQHQEQGDYQIISNYRDSSDKTLLTWNYHLAINYKFIPELELFTGIGIINFEQEILNHQAVYKYDTNFIIVVPVPPVTISRGYFNINNDSTGTVKNKFSYLEMPIGIRFNYLTPGNFGISFQPEISFNKLIGSIGYIYNFQNFSYEKIKSSDFKTWLVSYGVGLSFHYAIRKNLCIEFIPYYKNFQKSIYSDSYPVNQRFQQTEFRLSLRYLVK